MKFKNYVPFTNGVCYFPLQFRTLETKLIRIDNSLVADLLAHLSGQFARLQPLIWNAVRATWTGR